MRSRTIMKGRACTKRRRLRYFYEQFPDSDMAWASSGREMRDSGQSSCTSASKTTEGQATPSRDYSISSPHPVPRRGPGLAFLLTISSHPPNNFNKTMYAPTARIHPAAHRGSTTATWILAQRPASATSAPSPPLGPQWWKGWPSGKPRNT